MLMSVVPSLWVAALSQKHCAAVMPVLLLY